MTINYKVSVIGKTTLIEDFLKKHPDYRCKKEAYYKLQDEKEMELSLEPSLDSLLEQLDYSIEQLNKTANERNVIFDRCPIDFIAYSMIALEQDSLDINDSEVSERFDEIKIALNTLDLILFLPITKENSIDYTEENPAYRKAADKYFKKFIGMRYVIFFPAIVSQESLKFGVIEFQELKKLKAICNV